MKYLPVNEDLAPFQNFQVSGFYFDLMQFLVLLDDVPEVFTIVFSSPMNE